jgi:cytochrome c oxidase subunit 2
MSSGLTDTRENLTHDRDNTAMNTTATTGGRAKRRLTTISMAVLAALVATGCADDKPLNIFEPRSPQAREIDELMVFIWPITGVIFLLVIGGAIVLTIKNRVKPADYDSEDLPDQTHGNTPLELAWTIAPAVLLAAICIPMVQSIWNLEKANQVGELDVMVIGQQWWWEYRYDVDGDGFFVDVDGDGVAGDADDREWPLEVSLDPDDIVTANELVIPAGEQVDLTLTSRDVIHSFWIPRLNGKRDTVPGRWHSWSIAADEPGKYTGWCTEYCGLSHARMRMSTIALNEADWEQWWANQTTQAEIPTDEEALAGRELFLNNCQRCHVINDGDIVYDEDWVSNIALVSRAAPDLTHFATRSTFAGGIFGVYAGGPNDSTDPNDDALDPSVYVNLSELAADPTTPEDYRFNAAQLKRWISNAPSQKPMAPDPAGDTGLGRGMPAFTDLSDEQLDQLVAYLATLD